MKHPKQSARKQRQTVALVAALLLAAGEAHAASDGIVLFPGLLALLMIAVFVPLVPALNVLLFRPIFAVLDAREARTEGTRQRAAKLALEADEVLARYEDSVREVRAEAERERKQRLVEARADFAAQAAEARAGAEQEIERAREALAGELERARTALRADAEALAREAATRVLGRQLS